ncbi:coproporphyrinogen dehydrogenase HemZ [Oscillospiraceae bacterium WX1]
MTLTLIGHEYRYAIEQILLMMYPTEKPRYDAQDPSGLSACVALSFGGTYAVAVTHIVSDKGRFRGTSRARRALLTDKLTTDRLLQKIIKLSFFKAATAETGKSPVWGALTGIRPGKLATALFESGRTEHHIRRVYTREYAAMPERASLCIDTARAALLVKNTLCEKDVALYIGIPFCPTRCHYCSFVSHSIEKSMKLILPFLDALKHEISALSQTVRALGLRIIAVYIGGGTPTTLSPDALEQLMQALDRSFDLSGVREYTVEAGRPDTITPEKLAILRRNGVGRVSINPQTMSNDVLRAIGRRHTSEDVLAAMLQAREARFDAINMDLIAGLPGDTEQGFRESLDSVLKLSPENVTVHTLSLKKGTRVTLEQTAIPGADAVSGMLKYAEKTLRGAGYRPYYLYRQKFMSGGFENVGWCRPGFESLYNILIMEELCTILALGGGGVTKLVRPETGRIERIFNYKYPYEYIDHQERVAADKSRIEAFYRTV